MVTATRPVFGPYIQDDWKVTRQLTLNLGFRYDLYTQPVDAKNTGAMFDPYSPKHRGRPGYSAASGSRTATRGPSFSGIITNFAPRGSDWLTRPTRKLVIRSALGIFYSNRGAERSNHRHGLFAVNFRNINMPRGVAADHRTPPYRLHSPLIVSGVARSAVPELHSAARRPFSADVSSFNGADIGFAKFPMLQQFNLSVQYELLPTCWWKAVMPARAECTGCSVSI